MRDQFQTNQTKAKALVEALSVGQLNWKKGESWSVAECLAHLVATNVPLGAAIIDAVQRHSAGRPAAGGGFPTPHFVANMLVRALEPPPRVKAKAPAIIAPKQSSYGKDILEAYLASHKELLELMGSAGKSQLEGATFRHPLLPLRLPADVGLLLVATHDRRHLWQAEQVTKNADFPRS